MRIRRIKKKYCCSKIDEAVDIINTSYKHLTIRSIDWYNFNKDPYGSISNVPYVFASLMSAFLGKTITDFEAIHDINLNAIEIHIKEHPLCNWSWSLEMFEEFEDFIIN